MRDNIKKRGAILSAVVVIGFFLLYLATILFAVLSDTMGDAVAVVLVILVTVVVGGIIWGVAAALRQRLREIDGGEENAASQY